MATPLAFRRKSLADALALLMSRAGIENRSELARRANLDPSTISKYLSGTRLPSLDDIPQLEDALQAHRGALYEEMGFVAPCAHSIEDAIARDDALTPTWQKRAAEFMSEARRYSDQDRRAKVAS